MGRTLGEVVARSLRTALVGRDAELASLRQLFSPDGPVVAFVHGPAGIGKSALVDAFAADAADDGIEVTHLDCGAVEPTPAGFGAALAAARGAPPTTDPAALARALGDTTSLLVLDRYERFRLLDTWLRQSFLPMVDANVRVVIAGRESPLSSWWATPGWQGLVLRVAVGPLSEPASRELLAWLGVADPVASAVCGVAHGHPLALVVAGSALRHGTAPPTRDTVLGTVMAQLTAACLEDLDVLTRRAVEAAAVVRRVTVPLLGAMLADVDPVTCYDALRRLPFVRRHRTASRCTRRSRRSWPHRCGPRTPPGSGSCSGRRGRSCARSCRPRRGTSCGGAPRTCCG